MDNVCNAKRNMNPRILIPIIGVTVLSVVIAQESSKDKHSSTSTHAIFTPDSIHWNPGPPSLPPGAKVALLEGDPAKEELFTMRVLMPDGYSVPPHIHPAVEHVTVISGTLHFGMGDKFDKSATQPLPVGTFGYWPAGMKHFAWVEGETILQVHGMGPWGIQYLNPADDPRNRKGAAK